MSFFSFENPSGNGGSGRIWNYSNKERDDYSTVLTGILVELSDPLATKFQTNEVRRWEDGNPVRNICLTILTDEGVEKDWVFAPGSRTKPSTGKQALIEAWQKLGLDTAGHGIEDMGGMRITISTIEPPEGFSYSVGHPRPWSVVVENADRSPAWRGVRHVIDPQTEGQRQQQQGQQQAPRQQVPPQVAYAQQQAAAAQGFRPQPMQQAPQQQAPQPMQQAPQQQAPQQDMMGYYDQDIPF